ncbi:MAG: hypothetical protein CL872_04340 [Dehalococcoidaceae bacterium]|nr:hypothetical protein [Dehalococcoidaceae bacterium]|tara:strand:+ start:141 stop:794 length:654 start_codon:yes stop_codon:yes gene_type:complete
MHESPILSVSNLTKSFGRQTILEDINFEIIAGEKIALIGENGTGKTTLIKLISGLLKPTSGIVKILDHDMHDNNIEKPIIGICLDELMLDQRLTVFENLEFYSKLMSTNNPTGEINKLFEIFDCKNIIDAQINLLSSGMRQRINLIRALLNIKNQNLLLLDEPTKNLDYNSKNILAQNILCKQDYTIIVATHDIDNIASWASKIIEIKNNKIVIKEI